MYQQSFSGRQSLCQCSGGFFTSNPPHFVMYNEFRNTYLVLMDVCQVFHSDICSSLSELMGAHLRQEKTEILGMTIIIIILDFKTLTQKCDIGVEKFLL